jgi:hypothetical protein
VVVDVPEGTMDSALEHEATNTSRVVQGMGDGGLHSVGDRVVIFYLELER